MRWATYVPHTNSPPGVLLLLQAPLCYPLHMWLEAKPVEEDHTMRSNENEYYTQSQSLHHENGSSKIPPLCHMTQALLTKTLVNSKGKSYRLSKLHCAKASI